MLTAVLMFIVDATPICIGPDKPGVLLNYASGCVQHIISLLEQLYHNHIHFKGDDLKDTVFCLKSSFTYAAKLLNLILPYCGESFPTPSRAFDLVNDLLDLVILIESYFGSGYASRLVAAAKPWLPDLVLALGSGNILRHTEGDGKHPTSSNQMKLHFPKWPLIVVKSERFGVNEARVEEDDQCSKPEKFPAFSRLLAMLTILSKGNPCVMDAVGATFLTCSLVSLKRKDFGLASGFLHFVCLQLFKDDRDWGDLMLSSLQEIYPKIEREIAEQINEDEREILNCAKKLLEPLWMYHLYETGRVFMTEA